MPLKNLSPGAERTGGERNAPLSVWQTKYSQGRHAAQQVAGNRLDDASLLWQFTIPDVNFMLCCALWVKVWVAAENRHKENEFILSRSEVEEFAEETGIRVSASRLRSYGARQFAGTFSTHKGHLFAVELTEMRSPKRNKRNSSVKPSA